MPPPTRASPRQMTTGSAVLERLYDRPMSDEVPESPAERRRARLRFRAERRGFKEVDLIFGAFAAEFLPTLPDDELDQFEALLTAPDQDVFAWLKNEAPVPETYDTPVFAKLKSLCMRKTPTWNV